MADTKKKKPGLWERMKKRAGEEMEMLKNSPSAYANASNAEKQKAYEKKKRSKK